MTASPPAQAPHPGVQRPPRRLPAVTPRTLARHAVPLLVAVPFLLPVVFLMVGAVRPTGPPPVGLDLLPSDATLEAFRRLPRLLPVGTYIRNSLLVSAVAVPVTVLVASWAGFGIRLLQGRARRWAIGGVLALLVVPATAVWAPRFELFRVLGVTDTLGPLVAPAFVATDPLLVLLYAWSFARIPDDQFEAARLDGANGWVLWRRIAFPQVGAATLAVVVLAFAFHWGNVVEPLLYLRSQANHTLALGIRTLQVLGPTDWPLLMAGATVLTVPAVVVFLVAHRSLLGEGSDILHRPGESR